MKRVHLALIPFAAPCGVLAAAMLVAACASGAARPFTDPRSETSDRVDAAAAPRDPACYARALASTGGAMPGDPHTLAVRWMGYSNFELAYGGHILLLDAYYDRGSAYPPLGFKAGDVKRADAILIGHGHFDHMSDAAAVAAATGAVVVGAPVTVEKLQAQAVDPARVKTVTGRGGETLQLSGFTIEPILGRHGAPPATVVAPINAALAQVGKPLSAEEAAEQRAIRQRGTSDSRVIAEGTIAYLITLDDGFRILFRDSGGPVTEWERAAMERVGPVDLALVAVSAAYLTPLTAAQAAEHVRTYRPDVFMPAHHDAPYDGLWRATEPVFEAVKAAHPGIVTVSKTYLAPVCFNTEFNIQHGR